jgi:hypothetical protein
LKFILKQRSIFEERYIFKQQKAMVEFILKVFQFYISVKIGALFTSKNAFGVNEFGVLSYLQIFIYFFLLKSFW